MINIHEISVIYHILNTHIIQILNKFTKLFNIIHLKCLHSIYQLYLFNFWKIILIHQYILLNRLPSLFYEILIMQILLHFYTEFLALIQIMVIYFLHFLTFITQIYFQLNFMLFDFHLCIYITYFYLYNYQLLSILGILPLLIASL